MLAIGTNLIELQGFGEEMPEEVLQNAAFICRKALLQNLPDIRKVRCFNSGPVAIDKAKPETQKNIFDYVFHHPSLRFSSDGTKFLNNAVIAFLPIEEATNFFLKNRFYFSAT